jgi:hypothetical protein
MNLPSSPTESIPLRFLDLIQIHKIYPFGLFGQDARTNEPSITSYLYRDLINLAQSPLPERVEWLHQFSIGYEGIFGSPDITVSYRYLEGEVESLKKQDVSFPFAFIEYTKHEKHTVNSKLPQSFSYAQLLFTCMKPENFWTPLLGITMSEKDILFKIYVLTNAQNPKIAVIDLSLIIEGG